MSAIKTTACPEIVELERLAAGEAVADPVRAHVAECEACRSQLASVKENNSLLRELAGASQIGLELSPSRAVMDAIPGYEILSTLSSGGQGVVYRAEQLKTKRVVALKVLLGGALATARQRARFEREVELVAALRHPNIVTLFDSGTTSDGHPYYAMEFVDGIPLDDFCAWHRSGSGPQIPVADVIGLLKNVCEAVHYAHQRGIVHRDLKPANILIDSSGQPRILDFGLAKVTGEDHLATAMTFTGEFMGTFAYASPEQAAGLPDQIDIRTDVYSLGVIFYEMLTGQMPYPVGGSMASVVRNITEVQPQPPSAVRIALGDEIDTIVLKALAKEPERRYQSAGELLRDLQHYLAGEPIDAKRDSTWYVLRKIVRSHRWSLTAAAAVIVMLLISGAAVVAARIQATRSTEATARAKEESHRADAFSLVLHAAGSPRPLNREPDGYAYRDLERLYYQIRLGWLGTNRDREYATATLLSTFFRDSNAPQFAEELLRQESVQRTLRSGPNPREESKGVRALAEVLLVRNRLTEAMKYCDQVLANDLSIHGEDSVETARDKELLARIHAAQGDHVTAVRLAREAVPIQSLQLGSESLELAKSLDTLAASYLASGRVESAEVECLKSLRVRLAFLQDGHPDVVQSLRRLADIEDRRSEKTSGQESSREMGAASFPRSARDLRELATGIEKISKASAVTEIDPKQILRRHLDLKVAILGAEHNGLLSTIVALCLEARLAGDPAEAESLLTRALAIIQANQGSSSLAYANCLEMRSEHRFILERYSEAIDDAERSVDIWWALPEDRRDNLLAAANERHLAILMALGGQFERAAQRYQHCIDVVHREKGPENNILVYSRVGRAWAIMQLGRGDEAEREAREAYILSERISKTLSGDQRSQLWYYFGSVLVARGKFEEAEKHLLAAWEGDRGSAALRDWPPRSPFRLHIVGEMIKVCMARGDAECEARWRKELGTDN